MSTPAIRFDGVDVVFADDPRPALALLDQGLDRETVLERTGLVVGVHDASIAIEAGEICVLMGLSGSGKSSLLRCIFRCRIDVHAWPSAPAPYSTWRCADFWSPAPGRVLRRRVRPGLPACP